MMKNVEATHLVYLYVALLYAVCVESAACLSDVLTAQMVEWSLLRYCHRLTSERGGSGRGCVPVCAYIHFCGWLETSNVKTNMFQAYWFSISASPGQAVSFQCQRIWTLQWIAIVTAFDSVLSDSWMV